MSHKKYRKQMIFEQMSQQKSETLPVPDFSHVQESCQDQDNPTCSLCGCSLEGKNIYSSSSFFMGSSRGDIEVHVHFCSLTCEILYEINSHLSFMPQDLIIDHLIHDHGYALEALLQALKSPIARGDSHGSQPH
ncbi:hypothetical protein [Methanosarcina horonobensis]|uniref:hypothetical protein n=1 Tax=Methanosarcina horonobensis TaxID=418008 RepID=UPI00064FE106|nr:hypothetical protein [Methanosarcina horonobensis]